MKCMTFTEDDKKVLFKILGGMNLNMNININAQAHETKTRACVKCGRSGRLHKHHILYDPCITAFLCPTCHSRITGINAKGSLVAGGNKQTRPDYTNRLRITLWKWFVVYPWPQGKLRVSKTEIRAVLRAANFKVEPKSSESRLRSLRERPGRPTQALRLPSTQGAGAMCERPLPQ